MNQYLIKRKNRFYVRVAVPRPLWSIVGRREIQRTTGTGDLKLAERLKHSIIARIRDDIHSLACSDPSSPSWLDRQALGLRRAVSRGDIDSQLASDIISDLRDRSPAPDDQKVHATRLAVEQDYLPLAELIDRYLAERQPHVTASTLHKKRAELQALAQWLPADSQLTDIDRKVAGRFLTEVLQPSGRSLSTQKIAVGVLSAFINYCIRRGMYEKSNPWSGLAEDFKGIDVTLVEANRSYTSCFFFNRYVGGLRTLDSVTHDYRKLSSAFGIYTIHAEAVGAALTGGAPKPGKLENICYFLAARDHGLMTGGTYRTKDGKIAGVTGSISQVGEDDPTRKTTADQGDAWYDTVIREMFG